MITAEMEIHAAKTDAAVRRIQQLYCKDIGCGPLYALKAMAHNVEGHLADGDCHILRLVRREYANLANAPVHRCRDFGLEPALVFHVPLDIDLINSASTVTADLTVQVRWWRLMSHRRPLCGKVL